MTIEELAHTCENAFVAPEKGLENPGWVKCHEASYRLCTGLVGALQGVIGGWLTPAPYTIILPYPTFGQNHTLKARAVKRGGKWGAMMYDDPLIKKWQADCRSVLDGVNPLWPIHVDYRYGMLITFYMPDDRRDIDSMEKKTIDILSGYAFYNDRRVFQKATQKVLIREMTPIGVEPCVDITVWRIR